MVWRVTRPLTREAWRPPLVAGAASLLLGVAMLLLAGEPLPQFHDEFSYLLAAETFASGRLTSPTPEPAAAFESFQVLVRPTYTSKYPPAQGLAMAMGIVLTGSAIVGVWLASAAAAAATTWMLQARLPRRWALVGGLVVATHPLMLLWSNTYWGGSLALLGGALLLGGAWRLARRTRARDAIAASLGVVVLANARPYEGLVLTTLVVGGLAWSRWQDRRRPSRPAPAPRTALAIAVSAALLLANLAWMGLYNHAVTGSVTTLPYVAYERQYAVTPPLVFLPPPTEPKRYASETMRVYYERWERPQFERQDTPGEFAAVAGEKLAIAGRAWVRGWNDWDAPLPTWVKVARLGVLVPLLTLPVLLPRSRTARRLATLAVAFVAMALLALWFFPHYAAPIGGAIVFLHVASLRRLTLIPRSRVLGSLLLAGLLLAHAIDAGSYLHRLARGDFVPWTIGRFGLVEELTGTGSRWLVLVRSPTDRVVHDEWVYNGPDPATQAVVFARDVGTTPSGRLIADARRDGRRVLRVNLDGSGPATEELR